MDQIIQKFKVLHTIKDDDAMHYLYLDIIADIEEFVEKQLDPELQELFEGVLARNRTSKN